MKRLLELLLHEFTNPTIRPRAYDGLCTAVYALKEEMMIAGHQRTMLLKLIEDALQNKFITYDPKSYAGDSTMCIRTTGVFLYRPYRKAPRIKWLKKIIKQYD